MKRIQYLFLLLFLAATTGLAQDNRTTETRIADALALLPAKDAAVAAAAYAELMALDDVGLSLVMEKVRPSGVPAGVPFRYAVALLAQQATTKTDIARIENALMSALSKSPRAEVSQYYLYYLSRLGTNQCVSMIKALLNNDSLADPAIGALQAIGTPEALQSLRTGLSGQTQKVQVRIIQALGQRRDAGSVAVLAPLAKSPDVLIRKEALWSLALIGDPSSETVLLDQASAAGFKMTPVKEMDALIQYMNSRAALGGPTANLRKRILESTLAPEQQHFRLAALKDLVRESPSTSQPALASELDRFDEGYRRDVLDIAVRAAAVPQNRERWIKLYKKSSGDKQAEILGMLARANTEDTFVNQQIIPALESGNPGVRIAALRALAATLKPQFAGAIGSFLFKTNITKQDRDEAVTSFLQLAEPEQVRGLVRMVRPNQTEANVAVINIVSARRDIDDAGFIVAHTYTPNPAIRAAAFSALPNVASPALLPQLLAMLKTASSPQEIAPVQQALIAIAGPETAPAILQATSDHKIRLLPVLPYLKDAQALKTVKTSFEQGSGEERELAFVALTNWQNGDAIPILISILRQSNKLYHPRAFAAYVRQTMDTSWPADQKLLKLREAFPLSVTTDEKKMILREAGGLRTFLSFSFVSSWLDDPELGATASRATMRLALPTADAQPGLTGREVRKALEKVMEGLTGPDSQYDRIDVKTYLDQMPYVIGYEPLFNGKNLDGWQGLVENPIARAKMTKDDLAKKQAVADSKLSESWSVKDGMICFTGTGDNLCTKRLFGDFEMLVDWKISKNGDCGIYLRGSPQVQIWDTARVDVGAQVGSGGLYNNTVNRNPLAVADNPIGDWNTLFIRMVGERVTVYLNGILVVDNVVMENYWDRKIPIFPEGPIELQAHGTELAFRNVYVRELNKPYQLSAEEKQQGFGILFNGNDLSGWVGNKTDYVVDDHVIAIYPTGRGKGNLYTEKEYSDFIFRFEFMLTPAGNNGLGIHAPLEGDAAYVGKEIQILDDGHPAYANIQPYQAHGSVYGIIPAKRGYLRPTGEWNREEVEVRGDKIKVTLNGTVIVDGDMKKASEKGTMDKLNHPGLQRHSGHIGFLGHGSVVKFRNIRILDIGRK